MKRRNTSTFRTIIASPFTLVVAAVIFGLLARAAWGIHVKAAETQARLESVQQEYAKLEATRADVATHVDRLSTNTGIQAEIREKYHAVQPGESVAVIVDGPGGMPTSSEATAAAADAPAATKGWWAWFLGIFSRD